MPSLTIFTAPKPFTDPHINIIQRNAIQSLLHLNDSVAPGESVTRRPGHAPDHGSAGSNPVQVILVGDEDGLAETAAEFAVLHLPDVARNEWGTPLVSSIFALAREASEGPLLAYVNADILLRPDFVETARTVASQVEKFLVVGQRWDLAVTQDLAFTPNWDQRLRVEVQSRGELHAPAGSDYFIFPRSIFTDIPDFAIGRAGWDNWMIYCALQNRWPVVDATAALMIVHQNHDYSHLPGGVAHYDLEETQINASLGGGMRNMYMTLDASHEFVGGRVRRARPSRARILRRLERWMYPVLRTGIRWTFTRYLRRWRRKVM
ncbi:MAG: hypothetical protein KKD28_01190 [Chloroflexi bacterium]|nr:hypothetical protein [Chloroflexota bacterium]MBU1660069.1 hypothetical protein [Chloroflexota bacterium]